MFDVSTWKYGFVVIGALAILSGLKILLDHLLPDGKVKTFIGQVVDFLSANVKH